MGRKGRCVRNNKQVKAFGEPDEIVKAPHTFVLHRGHASPSLISLTKDFRKMMEPFTASALRERKSNRIKDFVSVSSVFHVSHMCMFNEADTQVSFKAMRLPHGPTLTFKVHQFTLARDVLSAQRKQNVDPKAFLHAPLVVLNSFSGEGKHIKMMANTFQNMFPSINLRNVQLSTIRRCVLLSYNPVTKLIDLRHYVIRVVPVGISKGIKKVFLGKIPDLSKCNDISEMVTQNGAASDSEFEDEEAQVILPQKIPGNVVDNKSSVILHELGPRITFQLMKIEDGLLNGEVLYHDSIVKTEEEVEQLRKEREKKKRLKEQRRKQQEENKEKKEVSQKSNRKSKAEDYSKNVNTGADEPEDDAEYYREEVGQDPDEALFTKSLVSSRPYVPKYAKKRKSNDDGGNKNKNDYENGPAKKKFKSPEGGERDKSKSKKKHASKSKGSKGKGKKKGGRGGSRRK